ANRDSEKANGFAAATHQREKAAGRLVIERRDLNDIGTPDKGPLAGTAQNGEPQLRVVIERRDGADDLDHQLPVETVQLADVVDRDVREVAAFRPLLAANQDTHRANSP